MYDHEQNRPYDVILSKIEVRRLLYDMNNFYKIQVNNAVALTYMDKASIRNSSTFSHVLIVIILSFGQTRLGKLYRPKSDCSTTQAISPYIKII